MSTEIALLRSSFELIRTRDPKFVHRFYNHLFVRHPPSKSLFWRNSREAQEQMVTDTFAAIVDHLDDEPWLRENLGNMGAKHVVYGVTPVMYDWVGEALLKALRDVAGHDWTDEVRDAWTRAYQKIATLMLAGAEPYDLASCQKVA